MKDKDLNGSKKIILIVLLCAAVFAFTSVSAAVEGDLDGDGVMNAADAAILFRMATGVAGATGEADLTGNNAITRADVRAALLMASGSLNRLGELTGTLAGPLLGEEALERFAYNGTVRTLTSYRSKMVSASVSDVEFQNSICHVLDVYVRDATSIRSAFSSGSYNGKRLKAKDIAAGCGAVFAVTGDMYEMNADGAIVRDGVWYKEEKGITKKKDVCVLYRDGTMEIFEKGTASVDILKSGKPVWQMWVFGPSLLDEYGEAKSDFNCNVKILDNNPRSALGYYGPGHYCLVVVDGRQRPYSSGLRMEDLSDLMAQLGCAIAYNLDGGQSAIMVDGMGNVISSPSGGGRPISDIVYIGEPVA